MKKNAPKSKEKLAVGPRANTQPGTQPIRAECPEPEAFLTEAEKEPKRKLISDHLKTITTLRDEKRFTFREIAEWFKERGFETDHSAVYRAYLGAIPEEQRDPSQDWSDIETPA